jgi:hypothetical protein
MPKKIDSEVAFKVMLDAGVRPLAPYQNSTKPWPSICLTCKSEVAPSYWNVKNKVTSACKYCTAKLRVDPVEAVQIMRDSGVEPLEQYKGVDYKWKSKCLTCSRTVEPTFYNVRKGTNPCRYCSRSKVDPVEAMSFMRSAGYEPLEEYPGGGNPWKCICNQCGNETFPRYSDILTKGHRCKFCSGMVVNPEQAVLVMKENGYEPLVPYKSNKTKWKCKHLLCGRVVFPTYGNIRDGWGGCKSCAPNAPLDPSEMRDFMISKNLMPLEPFKTTNSPWRCRCLKCGRSVTPSLTGLRHRDQGGCLYCAGKGTELSEVIPNLLRAGFKPLEPFVKSEDPLKCECLNCGEISYPRYKDVIRKGTECKFCTLGQFDYSASSYFYIAIHKEFSSIKIGISNEKAKTNRIEDHKKNGWELYKTFGFEKGVDASDCETAVLRWIRKVKLLPPQLLKEQMPQGGHTETVDSEEITVIEIEKYVLNYLNEKTRTQEK